MDVPKDENDRKLKTEVEIEVKIDENKFDAKFDVR